MFINSAKLFSNCHNTCTVISSIILILIIVKKTLTNNVRA